MSRISTCLIVALVVIFSPTERSDARPQSGKTVVSGRSDGLVVTITSDDGRLKAGENIYCVVFSTAEAGKPVGVHDVRVGFTLLVGKIQESPIEGRLTESQTGRFCGRVNLGKQYYVPADYYAFVTYTNEAGKKRKQRLFLIVK